MAKTFNWYRNQGEQRLIDNLTRECINMYGINCIYISREGDVDLIYGEDPRAKFSKWFEIPMWVKSLEGFQGGAVMQMIGMTFSQTITLQFSKRDFHEIVADEITPSRPREGDLIVLPYGLSGQHLLEISFVRDDIPSEQLGQDYIYEVNCRTFTYGNENLETGLNEIDAIGRNIQQELDIPIGTGTGTFLQGEIVFQGNSFVDSQFRAVVREVTATTLSVANMSGTLNDTKVLKGNTSGASHSIQGADQQDIKNDRVAQNKGIETLGDPIIVRNRRNPFDRGNQ